MEFNCFGMSFASNMQTQTSINCLPLPDIIIYIEFNRAVCALYASLILENVFSDARSLIQIDGFPSITQITRSFKLPLY